MPTHCSKCDHKIPWSTVSKAAIKSRRIRVAEVPGSPVSRRSLVTRKRAVSVLWYGLKPDWNFSSISLEARKDWSWLKTTISKTLDRNGSLEIGLKLDKSEGSKFLFWIRGWTVACSMFKCRWDTPWAKISINNRTYNWKYEYRLKVYLHFERFFYGKIVTFW